MKRRGFTLAEMMTVVAIIGMIAAIGVPQYVNTVRRSKEDALRSNIAVMRAAVDAFRTDTGLFPSSMADVAATSAPANGLSEAGASTAITATDWRGPYIRTVLTDPVSNAAFTYTTTSPNVGRVTSSASGNDSRGIAFSTY